MNINLYYTSSENNQLVKHLSLTRTLTGSLRNESGVVHPQILVEVDNVSDSNYAYISEFHRYYYIKELRSVRTGIWLLYLESDPLMSFKESIKDLQVVLQESENNDVDNYLADSRVWIARVKDKTSILQFPSGLSTTGEFVLITAGGGVSV